MCGVSKCPSGIFMFAIHTGSKSFGENICNSRNLCLIWSTIRPDNVTIRVSRTTKTKTSNNNNNNNNSGINFQPPEIEWQVARLVRDTTLVTKNPISKLRCHGEGSLPLPVEPPEFFGGISTDKFSCKKTTRRWPNRSLILMTYIILLYTKVIPSEAAYKISVGFRDGNPDPSRSTRVLESQLPEEFLGDNRWSVLRVLKI